MDTLFTALRVIVSLGVIVGLLWVVQRKSARFAKKKRSQPISVIGKQSLGSKASVVVVDIDDTRFVLGVTERAVSVLKSAEAPSFAAALDSAELFASSDPEFSPAPMDAAGSWKKFADVLRAGR